MARGGVAVWQTDPVARDPETNLARMTVAAARARELGASILVTPELSVSGYDIGELPDELTDHGLIDRLGEIARRHGIALVVGMALRDGDRIHNCSVIVDRGGAHRATHRKVHLYGDLDGSRFEAGESCFAMAELDGIQVATMVCYDVEFPESVRSAALAGAHLIAVPTANMEPWTIVNEYIVPARCFENQVVVAYANHCGRERDTVYVGRSLIAAPDGTIVRAGPEGETVLALPVDTEELERCRRAVTYLSDRRPALYSALTEGTR